MTVTVPAEGGVAASVVDPVSSEPYTLHLSECSSGKFVGSVRTEYEKLLADIAAKCFDDAVFKTRQAKELIAYVKDSFGEEPEYLWKKFPENAVWREKTTQNGMAR